VASGRVEFAENLVELWNSRDLDEWLEELGSDFEFTPDPSFPDVGTYRGEELRRWMHDWVAAWRGNRYEMLGVEELPNAILMRGRWHLATRQTGVEVPIQDFTLVLLYEGDAVRPSSMNAYFDSDQAREAAQAATG
jgi:hypothetical protein